ncbi:hypothetical protein [Faecalibacter macacae]|uniref:Uncharacterized protein n=1 Tax=Faecalibacter macacae TaxID=1859289 RepID=A0A3L9ML81_9FLAO|nr:hypothetical protein [Faecalibacter macacae]RLZ12014.1 hypothetical protein EAH69_03640 [Faecalibacter macacae]
MQGLKITIIILTYTILTSFNKIDTKIEEVQILRFLTAKSGFQSVEYNKGIISKWMRNKTPLVRQLNDYQKNELHAEIDQFDLNAFEAEINLLSNLKEDVYPKIYYRIIINGDTLQSKDFLQKDMPKSIKKIDDLMLKFTTTGFTY